MMLIDDRLRGDPMITPMVSSLLPFAGAIMTRAKLFYVADL